MINDVINNMMGASVDLRDGVLQAAGVEEEGLLPLLDVQQHHLLPQG